jgi:peptide/nickel transport system ATP-binding protein/oligopeptide transport system ATP-binding protein
MLNDSSQKLLQMFDMNVSFATESSIARAVDNVSLHINKGEIFGLVGESGSGKTMTALSIMRLIPYPGKIMNGKILFEEDDLLQLSVSQMESIRGRKISMIFQEPMTSLNPVFRVGDQVAEILSLHFNLTNKEAYNKTLELLRKVGFDEPKQKYIQYPHQLSGGQRQRILIAIAVACNPPLVIADEPTTALDVATEGQILCLLQDLVQQNQMSMLFITHNLHIIKILGIRVGIMYAGRLLEVNIVHDFFQEPLHPYSVGLLESVVWSKVTQDELSAIPGSVPNLAALPRGCKFHPRCGHCMPRCEIEEPPFINIGENKWVRCYLYQN